MTTPTQIPPPMSGSELTYHINSLNHRIDVLQQEVNELRAFSRWMSNFADGAISPHRPPSSTDAGGDPCGAYFLAASSTSTADSTPRTTVPASSSSTTPANEPNSSSPSPKTRAPKSILGSPNPDATSPHTSASSAGSPDTLAGTTSLADLDGEEGLADHVEEDGDGDRAKPSANLLRTQKGRESSILKPLFALFLACCRGAPCPADTRPTEKVRIVLHLRRHHQSELISRFSMVNNARSAAGEPIWSWERFDEYLSASLRKWRHDRNRQNRAARASSPPALPRRSEG